MQAVLGIKSPALCPESTRCEENYQSDDCKSIQKFHCPVIGHCSPDYSIRLTRSSFSCKSKCRNMWSICSNILAPNTECEFKRKSVCVFNSFCWYFKIPVFISYFSESRSSSSIFRFVFVLFRVGFTTSSSKPSSRTSSYFKVFGNP